jgi:antitoxin MazE
MKTEFVRRGTSLALRIPDAVARKLGVSAGRKANMTIENGAVVITVMAARKRRRYRLENLIEQIAEENRHPEVDWGPPVGNEAGWCRLSGAGDLASIDLNLTDR